MTTHKYETCRLIMRSWNIDDLKDLHLLGNSDSVMQYLDKSQYTIEDTRKLMHDYQDHISRHGFGSMACIEKNSNNLIGTVAFRYLEGIPHLINKVEFGWRIFANYWGNGYAGGISQKIFEIAFLQFNFNEIVAIVSEHNFRSIRALNKLGMITSSENNFIHPKRGSELNPYRLYTMSREQYLAKKHLINKQDIDLQEFSKCQN